MEWVWKLLALAAGIAVGAWVMTTLGGALGGAIGGGIIGLGAYPLARPWLERRARR